LPFSNRVGGSIYKGATCAYGSCKWFTTNTIIQGVETLPKQYRSVDINEVGKGKNDVFKNSPWRAPGTAPVLGSGCGVAGGGPKYYANGASPPESFKQGQDGLEIPEQTPTYWKAGSIVDVAWAITANHGGGYSYRLCRNEGNIINEECFQQNQLKFYGN